MSDRMMKIVARRILGCCALVVLPPGRRPATSICDGPTGNRAYSFKAGPTNPNVSTVRILGIEGMPIVTTGDGARFVIRIAITCVADAGPTEPTMIVFAMVDRMAPVFPDESLISPHFSLGEHARRKSLDCS